ncbi:MAG: bifunctional DNA-formamidopyrimidine glycosylase/DNA-(apurinic or apyrimidinic site) lyase, partial [Planctomycetota bacterium]|nr:bifunctional DNA-formamidopyrimidine glycosylase/DNA-(apurinic or apyrimidinic site) lyase [Planctomycetota bacterium]
MPELPEVETTRVGIEPHILKRSIATIRVRNGSLRYPVPKSLARKAKGQTIHGVRRRSKYLILDLDDHKLLIHLGMSGSLRFYPAGTAPTRPGKHDHIDLVLDNGGLLRYHDPRRFGLWLNYEEGDDQHRLLHHLGPEPLSRQFSYRTFKDKAAKRRIPVKAFIMDAKVVVGVGNIYAAESLFMSNISPLRPANSVTADEFKLLVKNIKKVLRRSIKQGGTTLNDFVGSDGNPGYFSQVLNVYGRDNMPCKRCSGTIKRIIQN